MANLEDYGKETYFETHGYTWDPRIESYVNKETWKIFSKAYLDDHPFEIIKGNLEEPSQPGNWQIYANIEAPDEVHTIRKHFGLTVEGAIIK